MNKINFIFLMCIVAKTQDCYGMKSILSKMPWTTFDPLPMTLRRGVLEFPQKFSGVEPENRKTNINGEKLVLFCPSVGEFAVLDKFCVSRIENDRVSCKKPLVPVLQKSDQLHIRCGVHGESVYYDFMYRTDRYTIKTEDYVIYRICFNREKKETVFTYHRIITPALLNENLLENQRFTTFEFSTESYQLPFDTFINLKSALANLNSLFTKKFSNPNELIFNDLEILTLVSPQHMAFAAWKVPAHHYANVKPAWKFSINLWNEVNAYIQNTIKDTEFIQISGVLDNWISNGKPVYIDDDNSIVIPKYIWKLVYIPAQKATLAIILHNVPNEKFLLDKLCDVNSEQDINKYVKTSSSFVYFCDFKIITDMFNLPDELDLLERKENFSPLVLSEIEGNYKFPKTFNGFGVSNDDRKEKQVLFCPPEANEIKIFEKNCLVLNEKEIPFCMKPVIPSLVESTYHCGSNKKDIDSNPIGYRLCFKNNEIIDNQKDKSKSLIKIYNITIIDVCEINNETITYHHIHSPLLLRNPKLENEKAIGYLQKNPTSPNRNFRSVTSPYVHEKHYYSQDDTLLKQLMLVPPTNLVFAAWRKVAYFPQNIKFAWSVIEEIWELINMQLQIQASDENQKFIHINGTMDSVKIDDDKLEYEDSFANYLWRVIYSENMRKSIAVIVHNKKEGEVSKKLCEKSECNVERWSINSSFNLEDFVYCCESKIITERFNLPKTSEILELKDYHLPLIMVQGKFRRLNLTEKFNGLDNLKPDQILFCPAETEKLKHYDNYCLFPIKKEISYCRNPVEAYLEIYNTPRGFCGHEQDSIDLHFKFLACLLSKDGLEEQSANVYTACFNPKNQFTYFTYNYVRSTALLYNQKLKNERKMSFKLDNNNYQLEGVEFTKINFHNKYITFPDSDGDQSYKLVPLLLASPGDMPFATWKKPLFHDVNVKPSWKNVVAIWDSINDHIRDLAVNETDSYGQRNGALELLYINNKPMYIDENKIIVPKFFWKLVTHLNLLEDIVIIVHNVPHVKYMLNSEKHCKENICKKIPELQFLVSEFGELVYCCDAKKIKTNFDLLWK